MAKEPEMGQVVMVKRYRPWVTKKVKGTVDCMISGAGFTLDIGGIFLFKDEGIEWDFVKPQLENK